MLIFVLPCIVLHLFTRLVWMTVSNKLHLQYCSVILTIKDKQNNFSSPGSDISNPRWRDLWWGRFCLLLRNVVAYCFGEPVGRVFSNTIIRYSTSICVFIIFNTMTIFFCVGVQRPRVLCVADSARPPLPPLRPRKRELLPGGEGCSGTPATRNPSATSRRY